mgnify:FL=1
MKNFCYSADNQNNDVFEMYENDESVSVEFIGISVEFDRKEYAEELMSVLMRSETIKETTK